MDRVDIGPGKSAVVSNPLDDGKKHSTQPSSNYICPYPLTIYDVTMFSSNEGSPQQRGNQQFYEYLSENFKISTSKIMLVNTLKRKFRDGDRK